MQQAGPLEVKADAQLGAHQRGVAKPTARACGVARKNGDGRLEKRTTLLTNTAPLLRGGQELEFGQKGVELE